MEVGCGGHGGLGERRLRFALERKDKQGIIRNFRVY